MEDVNAGKFVGQAFAKPSAVLASSQLALDT
jgi:hypothetical protein